MNGLGEYRTATIDGLPWQLRLMPTGHCDIREESVRPVRSIFKKRANGNVLRGGRLS